MARVTDAEVKTILETTIDTIPFITSANVLIDEVLLSCNLSTALLKQIELWLAAHFVAIRDPQLQSVEREAGHGRSKLIAFGKSGLGLDFTPYGQQVKLLDSCGKLASLGSQKASIDIL